MKKPSAVLPSGRIERLHPGLELLPGHVLGIEVGAVGLVRRHARQEGGVVVQRGPRRFVEPEVVQPRLAERRRVALQPFVERVVAAPDLRHEDVVQHARRLDEFGQRLAVAPVQAGGVHAQLRGREARDHLFELWEVGDCGSHKKHQHGAHGIIVC